MKKAFWSSLFPLSYVVIYLVNGEKLPLKGYFILQFFKKGWKSNFLEWNTTFFVNVFRFNANDSWVYSKLVGTPCSSVLAWGCTYVGGGIEEAIGIGGKGGDEVSRLASSDDETSLKASSSLAQLGPDFLVFSALSAAPASDLREALASKVALAGLQRPPAWMVFACWSDLCIRSLRSASKK